MGSRRPDPCQPAHGAGGWRRRRQHLQRPGQRGALVITAGQQVRPQMLMEAKLTNRCATLGPMPHVKWSHEPARPQDVPGAIGRAIHHASRPPRGPASVSIPMDDWDCEADEDGDGNARRRTLNARAVPERAALAQLAGVLQAARNPGARDGAPTSAPAVAGMPR